MGSPHDRFFREVFARPEHAVGLFRSVLPRALVEAFDWSTLTACPATLLRGLRARHVDLLFKVAIAGTSEWVYLLLEHKSRSSRWITLQLLEYELAILRIHSGEYRRHNRLPTVIRVVVQHGSRPWAGPTDLRQQTLPQGLEPVLTGQLRSLLSGLPIVVDDLVTLSEAEILARPMSEFGKLATLALQLVRFWPTDQTLAGLRRWGDLIKAVVASGSRDGHDDLAALDLYILKVTNLPPERLAPVFGEVAGPVAEETLMSTAERLIKKGRAEGHAEGHAEMLLHLLSTRFGPLPETVTDRVKKASPADLKRWGESLLTASSLVEIFGRG